MSIFITLIIFFLIVIIHELGHMLIAKLNNIYVKEFWIGFGKTAFSVKKGETKYCLNILPFGGACVFEDDIKTAEQPDRMFDNANVFVRIITLFAGPFANFLLAFLVSVILLTISPKYIATNYIYEVSKGSVAETVGLQPGDQVIGFNNKKINIGEDIVILCSINGEEPIDITYKRNGNINTVNIIPQYNEEYNKYVIGVSFLPEQDNSVIAILKNSFFYTHALIRNTITGLKGLITGKISFNNLGGIVNITNTVNTVYQDSKPHGIVQIFISMLNITVILSTSLGVMNLLPIPGIDGGRILFALFELISKKKIKKDIENRIISAAMSLVIILTVIITIKDIVVLLF